MFNGANWTLLSAKDKGVAWSSPLSFTIDKYDNKWIGLYDGLVKYDGTDWNYYKLSYGFPYKNIMYFIVSDSKGNILGGTNESGIIRFDGKYWTEFSKVNSPLPANGVSALYCDKHDNIWIGCCKYSYYEPDSTFGLMKFDGTNWTLFNVENSQLPSNYITAITEDDYGNIWIGTRNKGLAKYDGLSWKSYTTSNSSLPSKNIKKITIDSKGNKWFCSDAGLAELEDNSWHLFDMENSGLPVNTVNTVTFDSVNNMWMGTDSGLVKYDGNNWTLFNKWNSSLRENFVSSLAIDHKGIIWIGNNRFQTAYNPPGGLTRFDGENWQVFNSDNSPLPRNLISAIKVDSQNNKWIVYSDLDEMAPNPRLSLYGLFKFNDSTWKNYLDYAGLPIYALEFDRSGKLWVGGKKFGLTVFDGKSWKNYYRKNSGLPCDTVTSIAVDKNGYIWIGTFKGLAVTNGENWQTYDSLNSELKANIINSLAVDDSNNLWIAQMNNWVSAFNLEGIFVPSEISSNVSVSKYYLSQNYPNPFNPITTIEYSIAVRSNIQLKIFNILGREIKTLVNKEQFPGKYKVQFNASLLPSGVYIYTIQAGEFRDSKKLLLIK
jgi:ligand-binding sensor domain-containing protein